MTKIDGVDFWESEAMKYYAPPASWSNEKKQDNARNKIFSGDWYGAEKKDGYFSCFVKDNEGNMGIKTRSRGVSGEFADKYEWIPHLHPFFESLPNGTCLLGELYLPSNPGSKNITSLLGCLKDKCIARQEKGEKLHFYIFDCLAYNGESLLKKTAKSRFEMVDDIAADYVDESFVDFAKYYNGEDLWNKLQDLLASGAEGMVITKSDAVYEPGKRPSKTTLKIKQELKQTIDCVIMGANAPTKEYGGKYLTEWPFWYDEDTDKRLEPKARYYDYMNGARITPVTKAFFNKWAGSFEIGLYKDGELTYFGDLSGLTDEMKQNWRDYIGKVVEVGGMEIFKDTGTDAIRHPKMLGFREDKKPEECDWSQLD